MLAGIVGTNFDVWAKTTMSNRIIQRAASVLLIVYGSSVSEIAIARPLSPIDGDESPLVTSPDAPQRLPLERPSTPAAGTRPAEGSADTRSVPPQFGVFGNLGGIRDVLWAHGIRLNMDYAYQPATNVAGGDRTLVRGAGQFAARGLFDFQRLLGLEGGSGGITFTHREGRDVTLDAHLGTQTSVEEVFGRGRIWRLSQFWYDQKLSPWIDLKFGRLPTGDDFAGFSCEFQMNALCAMPTGKIAGSYLYNFPVSQWATRLRLGTADSGYLQIGAYQVNPDNLADGLSFDFSRGTGALILSEAAWFPKFGSLSLAGSYRVGGWYETGGGNDVYLNTRWLPLAAYRGQPLHRGDRHGIYFVGVQEVYRPDPSNTTRNVAAFVRAVAGDEETSTYSAQVTSGFIYKGWCAERPNDWIGLGLGQTTPNPRAVDAIAMSNLFNRSNKRSPTQERFVEAFYSIDVAENIIIRPNIQYITRRGSPEAKPDVVVLGLKSLINF
ncbi:carbohydrate porin [Methylobacterium sp. NEAU K]|nr:carbohydrate porin [Methylobacterium sp. NEAU K]